MVILCYNLLQSLVGLCVTCYTISNQISCHLVVETREADITTRTHTRRTTEWIIEHFLSCSGECTAYAGEGCNLCETRKAARLKNFRYFYLLKKKKQNRANDIIDIGKSNNFGSHRRRRHQLISIKSQQMHIKKTNENW